MRITYFIKGLLLASIFLLPLLGAYKGFGFEQAKILFFIFSISLIGFLWIFQKPKLNWNLIRLASFIFILTLFFTSFLGINPKNSLIGTNPYFQGWIVYAYLFVFSLIVSTVAIKINHYAIILTASSLVVSALAIQDWVLLNFFHQIVPTYAGRVVSSFGQPNFYSGFLLLTLPFSYYLSVARNDILWFLGWGSGIISLCAIMVSYSRSAILLALILLILGLFSSLSSPRRRGSINKIFNWIPAFAGMTVMVLAIAVFLSINFSSGFIWKEFINPMQTLNPDLTKASVESRVYIWPQVLKLGLEKPLFGYGLENINIAFNNYFEKYKHPIFEENLKISPVLISLKDLNLNRTHNYILDLFLFSGILSVLVWIGLIILIFIKLTQKTDARRKSVLLISSITYLIWIQFQNQSIAHLLYFWLLVGLIDQSVDK